MTEPRDVAAFLLPGAEQLLDAEATAEDLRATLFARDPAGATLTAVPVYLRLKPATMLVVAWRVELGAGAQRRSEHVHAILGGGDLAVREATKWDQLHPSIEPRADFVHVDPARDLVFARFPFDLGLKRLPSIATPARVKRLCEAERDPFGDGVAVAVRERGSEAALRSWRPRRRAVVEWNLRARADDGFVRRRAFARLLADPAPAGTRWRGGDVPPFLPRVLFASADGRVVVEERLDGAAFDVSMPPSHARLEALGELTGRFHAFSRNRRDLIPGPAVRWSDLVRRARDAMRDVAALAPALASAARAALAEIEAAQVPEGGGEIVVAHGDFHLGQVLERRDGALVLCDLDRAEPAARELDVARLLADAAARGATIEPTLDALIVGYRRAGAPIERARVVPFAAVSLLRSAGEPARRFERDAQAQVARRIELARELLARTRAGETAQ